MLNTHLSTKDDVDFIILCVGSNDITKLDTKGPDAHATNEAAIKHSSILVKLANKAAEKHKIDVFIMERPSRYDKKDLEKSKLNQVANGMLMPLTNVLDKVHLVRLPSLDNLDGKAKKELFKDDGIHLTDVGLHVFENDMITGIKHIITDVKPKEQTRERYNSPPPNINRSGGGHGRGNNHGPGDGYGRRGWGGPARDSGQQYHHGGGGDRQSQHRGSGNFRNNQRYRNRQEPGMQDMVQDFMAFMNNGPGMYRGGRRY